MTRLSRRSGPGAYGYPPHLSLPVTILLVLGLTACAAFTAEAPWDGERALRGVLVHIAEDDELDAYDRAVEKDGEALDGFFVSFWEERDPTPGTPVNEYELRFNGRLEQGVAQLRSTSRPDDRIISWILYGRPDGEWNAEGQPRTGLLPTEAQKMPDRRPGFKAWVYRAPERAGLLLREGTDLPIDTREFAFYFLRDVRGRYRRARHSGSPWPGVPDRLTAREVEALEEAARDRGRDAHIREAAVWRLGIDPGAEAFSALLGIADRAAGREEELLDRFLEPLSCAWLRSSRREGARRAPSNPRTLLGRRGLPLGWEEASAGPEGKEHRPDRVEVSRALLKRYDPSRTLSPSETERLRAAAASADSHLQNRGWLDPGEAARLDTGPLEEARRRIESGEGMAAHRLLQPLLRGERAKEAEIWHLDGLALLESGEPGGRQLGEERIREALRRAPGNLRYRLTLARVLNRRTLDRYADRELDRIISEVPAAADAWALKGAIRVELFWALGWRAGGWSAPLESRPLTVPEARAQAVDHLNRALVLDPGNALASWWLGVDRLMGEEWLEAVEVLSHMIRHGVHRAEAYLGRGWALQSLGQLDLAWRDYSRGRELLADEMRGAAEDPRWLLPPSAGGITGVGGEEGGRGVAGEEEGRGSGLFPLPEKPQFWKSRDPLFSTPLNERLLEQYRRFAKVAWLYAIPDLGLRGWETQRGRIYLRYGDPEEVDSQADEIRYAMEGRVSADSPDDTGEGVAWVRVKAEGMQNGVKETWYYPDFTFPFAGGMTSGNLRLWATDSRSDRVVDTSAELREQAERLPSLDRVVGGREVVRASARWYRFRETDGTQTLLPVLARRPSFLDEEAGEVPVHLIVLDEGWEQLQRLRTSLPPAAAGTGRGRTWSGPAFSLGPTAAKRTEFAALEIVPEGEGPAAADRDTLDVLSPRGLGLSSLVLASRVAPASAAARWPQDSHLTRGDRAIVPHPEPSFRIGEPLVLYFEVYGLAKDEVNATSYGVRLTVTARRSGGRIPLVDVLGPLAGREEEEEGSVRITMDRVGIRTDVPEEVRIVFPGGEDADRYRLTVEVEDRVRGERVSRSLELRLLGAPGSG
ncbi:MAG: GWxTD domain-containing protein [bacterium]